jgi:hypothetical protein
MRRHVDHASERLIEGWTATVPRHTIMQHVSGARLIQSGAAIFLMLVIAR